MQCRIGQQTRASYRLHDLFNAPRIDSSAQALGHEDQFLILKNWGIKHDALLHRFAALASGVLPFKAPGFNVAPLVPLIVLEPNTNGILEAQTVERLPEAEVVARYPQTKIGFDYSRAEAKRLPNLRSMAPVVMVSGSMVCVQPFGITSCWANVTPLPEGVDWIFVLKAGTDECSLFTM